LSNNIHIIDLGGVNVYLISTQSGFVLVDTGGHMVMDKEFSDRRELLLQALEEAGCTKDNLDLIILTHGDNDHVANAVYLREQFEAAVALHPDDVELVNNPTVEMIMKSFNYHSVLYRVVFKVINKMIARITEKTLLDFVKFKPDILLTEDFDLKEYGLDAKVLHIPGHTPGSIGILFKDGSFITGDTFTNIKKPTKALNAVNFNQMEESIRRLEGFKIKKIYPGHGKVFDYAEMKW